MKTAAATKERTQDVTTWGMTARGVDLFIDEPYRPSTDEIWDIDAEWNSTDDSFAGLGITVNGKQVYFFSELPPPNFFKDVRVSGHHVKDDVQMLRKWGINVSADQIVWDTIVGEYVRDSTLNRYGLKDVSHRKWGAVWPTYKELCGTGKKAVDIGTLPRDLVANYNGCDVLFAHKLRRDQEETLSPEQLNYLETIELPTLRVLLEMEERGVLIDTRYIRELDTRFKDELCHISASIRAVAGSEVNLNSHQQVKRLLLDKAGLRLKSTAHEELVKFEQVPLVKSLLRYRALSKLKGTYTEGLIERSGGADSYYLHTRFNQTATNTGRLSSSDPNVQNIPVRSPEGAQIRGGFRASPGNKLLVVDYSQIQPSLMAHCSLDPSMLGIFRRNEKIYKLVIDLCGLQGRFSTEKEMKAIAKILWLALAFNAGPYQLSTQTGLSFEECAAFIQKMETGLPEFFYWKNKVIMETEIKGYIDTLFGRRIPLRPEWAHLGPNYIIQGSESEIVKLALCATRHLPVVMTIHDEAVFDLPVNQIDDCKRAIEQLMSTIVELAVPLRVEMGVADTWLEAKS
jgi:DNA polymerase-1